MKGPRFLVAAIVAAMLAVGAASVAWACTALVARTILAPASGSPASTVTVSGTNFGAGPVTIHWNDSTGPVLATTRGPSFAVPVTVPATATNDVFYVVAVGAGSSEDRTEVAQTFEVTAASGTVEPAGSPAGPRNLWTAGQPALSFNDAAEAGRGGSPLALGVGLLSVSLVLLGGSATAVVLGRRRERSTYR